MVSRTSDHECILPFLCRPVLLQHARVLPLLLALARLSTECRVRPIAALCPFVGLQRTRPPGCLLCLNRTRVVGRDLSDGLAVKHLPDLQHAQPSAYAGSSSGAGFRSSSMSTRVFSL